MKQAANRRIATATAAPCLLVGTKRIGAPAPGSSQLTASWSLAPDVNHRA